MKKATITRFILCGYLILGIVNFGLSQTTLSPGDLIITGVNSRNPDQWSFVLLTTVTTGTEIHFTDEGWQVPPASASPGFRGNTEGIVTWTATEDLPCGTHIVITGVGGNVYTPTIGSAVETENGFGLAGGSSDQLLVYQGTKASPTFLYGISFGTAIGWTNATNANTSALPSPLVNGSTASDLGNFDNGTYNCTVTEDAALIAAEILNVNTTTWTRANGNGGRQTLGECTFCCGTTATWNGTMWVGNTPGISTPVIINGNYDTGANGSFSACSLTVNLGAALNVANTSFIEVQNDVIVDGTISVQTSGSFVQNDASGTFTVNPGGTSSVNKITPIKQDWFHYTYWGSPVANQTIDGVFATAPANRRFLFNANNFVDTNGDDIDDNADDWQLVNGSDPLTPGVGYAVTENSAFFIPGATGTANFEGQFNTGDIDVAIGANPANTGTNWNFIANPYPSALDFTEFQNANASIIDGAAYFWSQASPPSAANPGNEILNFDLNDYAIFTIGSGGTAGGVATEIPTGFIASCQGFFIPSSGAGTATFTNTMRIANTTSNSQFFKVNNSKKAKNSNPDTENKLWLNLTSGNGIFNQVLIAYVDGATDNNDGMFYDAPKVLTPGFAAAFYSLSSSDDMKYAIQGKNINSIDETEIIKLGISTNINVATTYSISIAQFQGSFMNNNNILLKDNLTDTLHNLSDSIYSFTSETGEFNDRFEIVFNANALSTDDAELNNDINIVQLDENNVKISTGISTIKKVTIYDLSGRIIFNLKGEKNTEIYNLSNLKNSVYIAKIVLANDVIITKKAIHM